MKTKQCRICKEIKNITDFYSFHQQNRKRTKTTKYVSSSCKECHRKKVRDNPNQRYVNKDGVYIYKERTEKLRIVDKLYQARKRKDHPQYKLKKTIEYNQKYPERISAMRKVREALRKKEIIKEKCRDCERLDTHGHHYDYSKPLDVIWLCPIHHKKEHLRMMSEKTIN